MSPEMLRVDAIGGAVFTAVFLIGLILTVRGARKKDKQ